MVFLKNGISTNKYNEERQDKTKINIFVRNFIWDKNRKLGK